MKRYTYSYGHVLRNAALVALVPFVIRLLRDFSYPGLQDAIQSALIFAFLFPLYQYSWELNSSLELGMKELILHRRIGRDRRIAYDTIQRVTVRYEEAPFGRDKMILTYALDGTTATFPITYLGDREEFIRKLQYRIEARDSRLLFQNERGEFLPSLEVLLREKST